MPDAVDARTARAQATEPRSDSEVCLALAARARTSLDGFATATRVQTHDPELAAVVERVRALIREAQATLAGEIRDIETRTEWNELVVSFFGETNAGKSTLIEALVGGRGSSIGDGTKDFTRGIARYDLDVGAAKPVSLLDMPGVEGLEERVLESINEAVGRSHAVFVVLSGKEPERGLLKRVRERLSAQATVYAIVNARVFPRQEMPPLETEAVREVANRTRHLLERELGAFFQGAAVVNAHVAFLARATELEPRFEEQRHKLDVAFVSRDHAVGYSGLPTLRRELTALAQEAPRRALVANAWKLLGVLQRTSQQLFREKKAFDEALRGCEAQLSSARERIGDAIAGSRRDAESLISAALGQLHVRLVEILHEAIDAGRDPKSTGSQIDTGIKSVKTTLSREMKQLAEDLEVRIRDELSILDARLRVDLGQSGGGKILDVQRILGQVRQGVGYFLGKLASVAATILGVVVLLSNPILAAIAGVLGLLNTLFSVFMRDPARKKREAKSKATTEVERSLSQVRRDMTAELEAAIGRLGDEIDVQMQHAKVMLRETRVLARELGDQLESLNDVDAELGTFVVRRCVAGEVRAAYVDLDRGACIVGANPTEEERRTLNLGRFLVAPTTERFVELARLKREGDWLMGPPDVDELAVRMVRAHPREFGVRGVRRAR